METLLSILGAIASIFGAIWALRESSKASKSASKAEKVANEIVKRRSMIEVSQVHAETRRILQRISKIGPSSDPKRLIGLNCADIARDVEEYSRNLNEQSGHFAELFRNEAKELCESLKGDIEELSEAENPDDIKKVGKRIYYKVDDFMPTAKQISDIKKERAIVD